MEKQTHFYGLNVNDVPDQAVVEQAIPMSGGSRGTRQTATEYAHSLFPRKRDSGDNRLPYSYAFSHPAVDETPLEETALPRAISLVAAKMPGRAAMLEHFYIQKLLTSYRRLETVQMAEERKLDAFNALAKRREEEIEAAQGECVRLRNAASTEEREKLEEAERELAAAHHSAGELIARRGGAYDPEQPSEASVLRSEPKPLEVFAAGEQLPYNPEDETALLPMTLSWVLTCMIGVMTGLSVGLMAHLLEADAIGQKPMMALICVLFGVASAIFGKYAVLLSFRHASERYYLGRPASAWGAFAAIGSVVALCLTGLDSVVERAGLLSLRGLENAVASLSGGQSAQNDDAWIYLMGAILITFGYVVCSGWEGYVKGRFVAVSNRLLALQRDEFEGRDRAEREESRVQEALRSIAVVRERLRTRDRMAARVAEIEAPFAAQLARWEARRLQPQDGLSETAKRLIEDASDDYRGCQATFDQMLEKALVQCEPLYGWWERVIRAILGERAAVRLDREHRSWRR